MTIKVEDAISNLKYQMLRFAKGTEPDLALKMAIEALKERKTGKWVHGREIWREHIGDAIVGIGYEDWRCSECHTLVKDDAQKVLWKYCPWCGAKMEGVE